MAFEFRHDLLAAGAPAGVSLPISGVGFLVEECPAGVRCGVTRDARETFTLRAGLHVCARLDQLRLFYDAGTKGTVRVIAFGEHECVEGAPAASAAAPRAQLWRLLGVVRPSDHQVGQQSIISGQWDGGPNGSAMADNASAWTTTPSANSHVGLWRGARALQMDGSGVGGSEIGCGPALAVVRERPYTAARLRTVDVWRYEVAVAVEGMQDPASTHLGLLFQRHDAWGGADWMTNTNNHLGFAVILKPTGVQLYTRTDIAQGFPSTLGGVVELPGVDWSQYNRLAVELISATTDADARMVVYWQDQAVREITLGEGSPIAPYSAVNSLQWAQFYASLGCKTPGTKLYVLDNSMALTAERVL